MTKSLFDKTSIGTMKLKNRIFMSPMGTTGEADGAYNIDAINYFMERAKGVQDLLLLVRMLFLLNMNHVLVLNYLISIVSKD